jgi:hypothetical protein
VQDSFAGNRAILIFDEVAKKLGFHQGQLKVLAAAAQLQIAEVHSPILKIVLFG